MILTVDDRNATAPIDDRTFIDIVETLLQGGSNPAIRNKVS